MFKNDSKKKVSIDFLSSSYAKLGKFIEIHPQINSNSTAVNYIITVFADLPRKVKDTLAKACYDAIKEEESRFFSAKGVFEKEEATQRIHAYREIMLFVTDQNGYTPENDTMKKIQIKNGYVLVPTDWVVVENIDPVSCEYVGVIEVRNGEKYNAPHVVFFSTKQVNQLSAAEEDAVVSECINHCQELGTLRNMEVKPIYDDKRDIINAEEYMAAPRIGVFAIPTYGSETTFPEGAMIVRE